jgi:hypothetical protein
MAERKQIEASDILVILFRAARHVRRRWHVLVTIVLIGALLGVCYSLFIRPQYTAVCTFVLDEGNHEDMLGQYSGLASLAGLDLAGGGGGIFKGDNIIELYKSRAMIKKTLFTAVNHQLLINRYMEYNHLQKKWGVSFTDTARLNRRQDSVLTDLADRFNLHNLEVAKPDKKLSIIQVAFTCKDEFFAKEFTDNLVRNVNNFYVQTKTKKTLENVSVLQHQADSVKSALNSSINGVDFATEAVPLANPILTSLRSSSQRKQVDVQAAGAIYSEIIKNLELSKISLLQQTPLIQFIDQPIYPLKNNHIKLVKGILGGIILGFILGLCFLFAQWLIKVLAGRVRLKLNKEADHHE